VFLVIALQLFDVFVQLRNREACELGLEYHSWDVGRSVTCLRHVRWAESPLRYKGIRGRLIQRDESGVGGVHEVDGRRHEEDVSNVGDPGVLGSENVSNVLRVEYTMTRLVESLLLLWLVEVMSRRGCEGRMIISIALINSCPLALVSSAEKPSDTAERNPSRKFDDHSRKMSDDSMPGALLLSHGPQLF
jgi:hypothetical protein